MSIIVWLPFCFFWWEYFCSFCLLFTDGSYFSSLVATCLLLVFVIFLHSLFMCHKYNFLKSFESGFTCLEGDLVSAQWVLDFWSYVTLETILLEPTSLQPST